MPDLRRRSAQTEWLDTASPTREARAAYLRSLAFLNGAMLGHRPVLAWLDATTRNARAPLTLLDVGCGHGDLLRAIRRFADRRGIALRLIGVDIAAETIAIARAATAPGADIDYVAADVFNLRPAVRIDLVVSSLLAHHLDDVRLAAFLRFAETMARRGWLIVDLERHPVPYHAIGFAGRLLRIDPKVIADGRISVTRALRREEWRAAIAAAGIDPDAVKVDRFLWRVAVSRRKD